MMYNFKLSSFKLKNLLTFYVVNCSYDCQYILSNYHNAMDVMQLASIGGGQKTWFIKRNSKNDHDQQIQGNLNLMNGLYETRRI